VTIITNYNPFVAYGVGSNLIDPIERHMVVDCISTWAHGADPW